VSWLGGIYGCSAAVDAVLLPLLLSLLLPMLPLLPLLLLLPRLMLLIGESV
jgi:hypothetical protein